METTHHTEKMSAGHYAATRLTTLKPARDKVPNPVTLLRMLNLQQWLFFLVAFFAWTWDAFDFFTVSLTVENLAETFGKTKADITWGITLVLMLRSVGSIIFGLAADRYGRKWPFIINNVLFIVLELGTGFCSTYNQFLGVRALFGIAMGGLYGNAAATALEDCPSPARGIISGMLQQGYAFGYLLATVFARAFVDTVGHEWRPLFWFGAGPPVLIIIFRLCLPETNAYLERKRIREEEPNAAKVFVQEGKVALKRHWLLLIYMVLLMAGTSTRFPFSNLQWGEQLLTTSRLQLHVPWLPRSISHDAIESIQFQPQRRHRNTSRRQPRRHDRRHGRWLQLLHLRAPTQHHHDVHPRRRIAVPIHIRQQQGCYCCCVLPAVLRPGRMGR